MRFLALLLSIHVLTFSTQPAWHLLPQQLGFMCCKGESCPASDGEEFPEEPCCPPFACCFPVFSEIVQPAELPEKDLSQKHECPFSGCKRLLSSYLADTWHPPEVKVA